MSKERKLQIRNSTAEFLIFTRQAGEGGIEVRVAEETVWLTQKLMASLFAVTVPTINEHLTNLLQQGEITAAATIRNSRTVQKEGGREVARNVVFYNLDAIIAVGFRVNSARAIQFRQWATGVLRDYAFGDIKGLFASGAVREWQCLSHATQALPATQRISDADIAAEIAALKLEVNSHNDNAE